MSSRINRRKQSGSSSLNNQLKKFDDYYLGLDIGTDSIGWCVTDPEYNILKFNGKAMWGIRLFDEAEPAASRRSFRTSLSKALWNPPITHGRARTPAAPSPLISVAQS